MVKCIICFYTIESSLEEYYCYCRDFSIKYTHNECITCHLKSINTLRCPLCNCALWLKKFPLETDNFYIIVSENSIIFELKQKGFNTINNVLEILDSYNCVDYKINNNNDEIYGQGEIQILDSIKYNTLTKIISYIYTLE